jgi:hypothetical protein
MKVNLRSVVVLVISLAAACGTSRKHSLSTTPDAAQQATPLPAPAAICLNCGHGGGGDSGGHSGSSGGSASKPMYWCEQNGGVAGLSASNSFSLHVISMHHGKATGNVPINSDLQAAAFFFASDMAGGDPSGLVAFPAAPAGCGLGLLCGGAGDQGYNTFASDQFISNVNQGSGPK